MLKKVLLIFTLSFLYSGLCQISKKKTNETTTVTPFPELFRDHIYYSLTNRGKEMFHAINIHPLCAAKKGNCIPRGQCTGRDMVYISRACYKWDLVCCYDNSIKFPEVAWKQYTPPPPQIDTRDIYIEPPVEP